MHFNDKTKNNTQNPNNSNNLNTGVDTNTNKYNNYPSNSTAYNQTQSNFSNNTNPYLFEEKEEKVKVIKSGGVGAGFFGGLISSFLFFSLILIALIYFFDININDLRQGKLGFNKEEEKEKNSKVEVITETTKREIIDEDSEIIKTVKKTDESVVSIVITQNLETSGSLFDSIISNSKPTQVGAGTGFVVSKEGHIITNRHVVSAQNASYTVVFSNGQSAEAKVLDRDAFLDIAVLKVDSKNKDLKPLPIGKSSDLQMGQTVLAIGNSLGRFGNSVSRGIISGLGRNVIASDGRGGEAEMLTNVIQTDASINPGNSGGPLLDIQGNVIGVNVARADADNVAFAIPIDDVKIILETVIETGQIQRPFIGIRYRDITPEIAQRNNLKFDYGAVIISQDDQPAITPNSPAEKAGLKERDIILEINKKKITPTSTIPSIISGYRPGDEINLKVLRDKEVLDIKLVLDTMKK